MGKGDKKSRRGKIYAGSFGKRRPRKRNNMNTVVKPEKVKKEEAPKPEAEPEKVKTEKTAPEEKKTKKGRSSKKGSKG